MAKADIVKNLAKGVLLQEGTSAILRIPVVGEILQQGVSMVSQVVRSIGGESLETEIVDSLPARPRSVAEAALRKMRGGEGEDDTMAKKTQKQGGGKQPPSANTRAKVLANLAGLQPEQRKFIRGLLDKIPSVLLRENVYQDLSVFSPAQLANVVRDLTEQETDVSLVRYLGLHETPEAKEAGIGTDAESEGVKAGKLLGKLSDAVMKLIINVTSDIANDSPEDQANFNRKMANLYGDGSEEAIKRAKKILGHVSKLDIKERRTWFNVRPNRLTQLRTGLKKVFTLPKVEPVSDGAVAAAKGRADDVWERIRSKRAARTTH